MRDKNRIKTLMKTIKECWEFNPDISFYELLYGLYHDIPEEWNLYYKEDDFWKMNMEDYKLANLGNENYNGLNKVQKEILTHMKTLWEKYYDLRFPQICNVLYSELDKYQSDLDVLESLRKKVGDIDNG